MDQETRHTLNRLSEKLDSNFNQFHSELATIKRGIYGDEANQVKGLLTRQNEDDERFEVVETRMSKMERKQFKQGVVATGLLVSIQLAWNTFKDFFR